MNVYVAYCSNRHCDPEVNCFMYLPDAREYCHKFMAENCAHLDMIRSVDVQDFELWLQYGEEADHAFVVECYIEGSE